MNGFIACWQRDGQPLDPDLLLRLTRALHRRGTNREQTWQSGSVGLGQTWLDGCADTVSTDAGGRQVLVGDVRLDRRGELIERLGLTGSAWTDKELVLHSYARWGHECVNYLHGDFSFVTWDVHERRLFAARDRFGVCPLFYVEPGNAMVVSNTLTCLRHWPGTTGRLNEQAIGDFLLFGYNLDLRTTTFADVQCVSPAHVLSAAEGDVALHRYWRLPVNDELRLPRLEDYCERFRFLLLEAVRDRAQAPAVSVHLSGGLDSASVAAAASRVRQERSLQLQALTAYFAELLPDHERHYAVQTAHALGVTLKGHRADEHELYAGQRDGRLTPPEPCHAPLSLAVHHALLCMARAHGQVLLTGYGPDALLRGSSTHALERVRRGQWGRLLADGWRAIRLGSLPRLGLRAWWRQRRQRPSRLPDWLEPSFATRCQLAERLATGLPTRDLSHPRRPESYTELTGPFWPRLFETYDAGWTGVPIRVSHPYFDERLVDYLLAIPVLPWCNNKLLLRSALHGWLPNAILRRRKTHLADNPERVVVQRSTSAWVDGFRASHEFACFVVRDRIPKLSQGAGASGVETHLLPLSLQLWLDHQESLLAVESAPRSEDVGHAHPAEPAPEKALCQAPSR